MAYKLVLPKFGMAMQRAKVIEWKKETGDYVKMEEAVLVVENEKLVNEIISMQAGVLLKKVALVGEDYLVGDTLAWLGAEGEIVGDDDPACAATHASEGAAAVTSVPDLSYAASEIKVELSATIGTAGQLDDAGGAAVSGRVSASPLAKKLAAELGVDYTQVPGTGAGGRIDKEDVLKYAEALREQGGERAQGPQTTVVPYTGMRKAIGDTLHGAWSAVPMVTHHVRADAGTLLDIRKRLNDGFEDKDMKYSVNDLLLALTAAALKKVPALNATFHDDGIHIHRHVNLGMAVALENGLVVPVIHNAEEKSVKEIRSEAGKLIADAKAGRLILDNVSNGTFTISNLGGYGSVDFFNPIINPPQVAILGVGRIADTVVPVDGEIKIRPLMGISLTIDHRAFDGAVAAVFMKELMALIEDPMQVLS